MAPREARLSDAEKRGFLRDGYVVVRGAVPPELTRRARALIHAHAAQLDSNPDAGERSRARRAAPLVNMHDAVLALLEGSALAPLLRREMGPYSPVVSSNVAVTPPFRASANVRTGTAGTTRGYGGAPAGFAAPAQSGQGAGRPPAPDVHIDGSWAGMPSVRHSEIVSSGRSLHDFFKDGDPRSLGPAGQCPLWQDPGRTLSLGSYTAIVGVALSDQRRPGKGQFAVRRGAHEANEAFFRMQRDRGGPVGPEGPEWPRLVPFGGDRVMAGGIPAAMRRRWPAARADAEGWPWPELTPILMGEGDAVIALHATPHTATPNLSADPRINVYFRIRRFRPENPHELNRVVAHGISDHPDRGLKGQILDYPASYDPYKISIEKLCDHWSEWDGMQEVVAERRLAAGRQRGGASRL